MAERRESAGILPFRRRHGTVEVLIAHPGGPFWARRDEGAWTIPKGEIEPGEDPAETARRELAEEIGVEVEPDCLIPLGSVTQRAGKRVHAWAVEVDDVATDLTGSTVTIEWPPRSGRSVTFPEIDRVAWVAPDEALAKLNPAQRPLVERLLTQLPP